MFLKHRSKIRKSSGKTDAMILELIDIYYRNCIDEWELRQMFFLPPAVPERSRVGLTIHKTLHGQFSWWLNMITKCKGCPGEHEIKHILLKPYSAVLQGGSIGTRADAGTGSLGLATSPRHFSFGLFA